jgi:hypothetical protein
MTGGSGGGRTHVTPLQDPTDFESAPLGLSGTLPLCCMQAKMVLMPALLPVYLAVGVLVCLVLWTLFEYLANRFDKTLAPGSRRRQILSPLIVLFRSKKPAEPSS